jgi:three-Cys-motif partner protein
MSSNIDSRKGHRFGGDWTDAKLQVLEGYLRAYTMALKDKPSQDRPFKKIYIDAFAGTGYRESCTDATTPTPLLLPDLIEEEPQGLLDGSARVALKNSPQFDEYVFIERSAKRCLHLEDLKKEFPALESNIAIRQGDANDEIQAMCTEGNWRSSRAVLFLDPYGMQVDWKTIEAIAKTEAIDLWLLFPFGIGVNRLLKKDGDIPDSWRRRLDLFLGTEAWYHEFYKVEKGQPSLFGDEREKVAKVPIETIGRFFVDRLKSVFPGVAGKPGVLRNSANNPLYLLCFAAGNKRGAPIALEIAKHLLKDLR